MSVMDSHSLNDLMFYPTGINDRRIMASCLKCNWLESFEAPAHLADIKKAHSSYVRKVRKLEKQMHDSPASRNDHGQAKYPRPFTHSRA